MNVSFNNFCIIKENSHEETVIRYTMKFMRLLNSYLIDEGTNYNTEKRVTYRGVSKDIMKNAEVGKIYRIILS